MRIRCWWALGLIACGSGEPPDADDTPPVDSPPDTDTDTDPVDTARDTGTAPVDPATVPLDGPCPMASDFGGFGVEADALLTVAAGAVADGVVPLTILEEAGAAGDCLLLRRVTPYCEPSCGPSETCDFDGTCIPYPIQQDVGTVTIDGLLASVEMEPTNPSNSYYQLGLPHPAYAPGQLITLRATGGTFAPFVLHGVGIEPLQIAGADWVMAEGSDLVVRWTPPASGARSTVNLAITIDQHGSSPIRLDCEFPDSGEGTVDASLIDELIGFGVTGFPSASLTRRTVDSSTLGAGCVDFEVSWSGSADLTVAGHAPCTEQADCPAGQTCNVPLEICE